MAANFEEIFRSFVVNKFKEIQGETMSSETCETQMNGGEIQPVVTEIPTEGAVVCVQSVQNEHIVQKIEGVHSETVDTEPQPSSDLKLNLPVNKSETADVLPEEVRNESPRKKSKKHKKHKSKKKKKRKKEKKERQKLKSLITECQGNVEMEHVPLSTSPHAHTAEMTDESRSNKVLLDTRTIIESETSRLVVESESAAVLNFDHGSQTKTASLEEFGPHNVPFKETTLSLQEPNGTDLRSGETLHSADFKTETVPATSCTVQNTDFEVLCKRTDTEQTLRSKGSEPSRFQNTDSLTVVTKSDSDLMVLNTDTNLAVDENTHSTALTNAYRNQTVVGVIDPCLTKVKSEVSDGAVDTNPDFHQTEIQKTDIDLAAVLNPDPHRTIVNPDLAEVKHLDSYLTEGQDMDVEVVVETNMDCNLTQHNVGTDLLPVLPSQMMKIADVRPAITAETDQTWLTADFEPSMITADLYHPVIAECSHQPILAPNSALSDITAGSDQPGIFVNFVQPTFTTDSDRPAFTADSSQPAIAADPGRPAIAADPGRPAIAADPGRPAIMEVSDQPGLIAVSDQPGLMAVSEQPVSDQPGAMAVSCSPRFIVGFDHPGVSADYIQPAAGSQFQQPVVGAQSDQTIFKADSEVGLVKREDCFFAVGIKPESNLETVKNIDSHMVVVDNIGSHMVVVDNIGFNVPVVKHAVSDLTAIQNPDTDLAVVQHIDCEVTLVQDAVCDQTAVKNTDLSLTVVASAVCEQTLVDNAESEISIVKHVGASGSALNITDEALTVLHTKLEHTVKDKDSQVTEIENRVAERSTKLLPKCEELLNGKTLVEDGKKVSEKSDKKLRDDKKNKRSRSRSSEKSDKKERDDKKTKKSRSRSRSKSKKQKTYSGSHSTSRHSPSKKTAPKSKKHSDSKRKRSHSRHKSRSRSRSTEKRKDAQSSPKPRSKRSRSRSPKRSTKPYSRSRRSRSRSPARKRKSRSKSTQRSRSRSRSRHQRKTKSRSKSVQRSRSRSHSRLRRKTRSRSRSRRRRSPSRDRFKRSPVNHSKTSDRRRRRSNSRDGYSTSLKPRGRSRSPGRRRRSHSTGRGICKSPVRRRRSRSPARRSRSPTRSSRTPVRKKSFSRSPDRRNRSRSLEKIVGPSRSPPKRLTDSEKAQLLQIAKANAAAMCVKTGIPLPQSLKSAQTTFEERISQRSGGTTMQELMDKCKQIAQSKEDDEVVNKPHVSDDEDEARPFFNHPFKVSEHKAISFSLNQ